jgi:hypothetical protein
VALKDVVIGVMGPGFYGKVMQPFDRYLVAFPPNLSRAPFRPSTRVPAHPWRRGYDDLGFSGGRTSFITSWEFNQALYGLRALRRLARRDRSALGAGTRE